MAEVLVLNVTDDDCCSRVSEISLPAGRLSPCSGTDEVDVRRHSSMALTTSHHSTDDSIADVHSHISPPLHHSSSRDTPVSLYVFIHSFIHSFIHPSIHPFIHFWHAPLWVRSAKSRHQSPEWTIVSHVNCFVQGEVHWFQVLLRSLHPHEGHFTIS